MLLGSRRFAFLFAGLLAASPRVARADDSRDRAAARSAAEAGGDAFDQGDYAKAFELFSRAENLLHAPPHLLFIARSAVKLGRLVEAHEAYMKIVNEQLPKDAPKAFRSAHKDAEQEVGAVEGRIAHVTITVGGPEADKAVVNMDKVDLPSAVVGIPMPVDPGSHLFYAHTERVKSNALTVTLRDAGSDSVNLVLPNPPADAPLPNSGTVGGGTGPNEGPGQDRPASASGGHISGQRIAGYVTLGVGAVGVGVGSYFLVNMLHKRSEGNDLYACNETASCSDDTKAKVLTLDAEADKERNKAIVSYSLGGAALVTGLVLLLTDSPSPAAPASGAIRDVHVLAGLGSVAVSGKF